MTRSSSNGDSRTLSGDGRTLQVKEPMAYKSMTQRHQPTFLQEETLITDKLRKLSPRLKELVSMLEYARPEDSATEEHFITSYLDTLPGMTSDAFGNRICKVGRAAPTIAWSSHTDTVHYDEGTQALEIDKHGCIALDWNSDASCLGADCTAGVWLMRRLILAGKPGLYIFHRKEESGGQGAKWITSNTPELVDGIQAMIALDRYGYSSVITEQTTGVTASKRFAASLAGQLGGAFEPDNGGIFTDSAFYNHLIPECTNLSVGYFNQHGSTETLDYEFTDALLIELLRLDYGKLEIARDPKAPQVDRKPWRGGYYYHRPEHDDAMDQYYKEQWEDNHGPGTEQRTGGHDVYSDMELVELVRRNPEAAARLLRAWDLTEDDLYEAIRDHESGRD